MLAVIERNSLRHKVKWIVNRIVRTENEFEICCHGKDYCETLEKQIPETNENGTLDESEPGEIQPASMNLPDNITDLCDIVENFQDMEGTGGQERRPDTPRSERDNSVAGLEEQIEVNYPRRSQRKVNLSSNLRTMSWVIQLIIH